MARTLVNAHQLAHFSGSSAIQAKFAQGIYTGGMSMESGSVSSVGTLSFYDGGSISYEGSKIQLYNNTNIEGTLTANTSLTLDAVTITTAEIGVLDGVTAGTAAASKALVLDGSKNIATIGTVGCGAITSTGNSSFAQGTFSGRVIVDDATEATTATDGSLQTDGGLSVAKSAVIGDDLDLLSNSAIFKVGSDEPFTLTHANANNTLMASANHRLAFGDAGEYIAGDGTDLSIVSSGLVSITGNTNIVGTLSADTSLTLDTTTITTAEIGVLDSVTAGTAAASKAVVLDGSKNIATIGTIGCGAITSTGNSGFGQVTTSGRVIVDDATDATSTTDGSLQTDGGLSVAKDVVAGNDVKLLSDSAVLSFGADSDVTLTHIADQALLLNSSRALSFGDAGTYIHQVSDGILKVAADNTVLVSSDTMSIESANANDPLLQMKNTNADGNGSIFRFTKDGASVADNDVIGVVEFVSEDDADNTQTYAQMVATIADASSGAEGGRLEFKVAEHDGSVTTGLKLQDGDADGEIDVTLGAGANSVVTIPGNLNVAGTTTTVNTVTMEAANAVVFEGATADGNETTLSIVDPTADHTQYLINQGGYIPVLAAVTTTAITSTPAEINLLDGGTAVGSSITIADGDGMIIHDGGTMKTIPMSDVKTYCSTLDIDGYNALGGTGLHQTDDHFIFSDNGTEKKITFSNLEDAIFANISGDATVAAGGALTIAANAVEGSMLNNNVISGLTDIGANLATTDEIMVSDNGTLRRTDLSRLALMMAADGLGVASGQLVVDFEIDTVIGSSGHNYNSTTGVYTCSETAVTGSEMVFLNGQMLNPAADLAAGDYTIATGSVELHPDLKLDGDDVLRVYYLGT